MTGAETARIRTQMLDPVDGLHKHGPSYRALARKSA